MTVGAKTTVLVVDDDELIRRLLQDILKSEFDVVSAPDGVHALKVLRERDVAAIVADQMMPSMTGVELLHQALEINPRAARIMVTASGEMADARDAINVARVGRYVSKPFRPLELIEIVRGAIREQALQAENEVLVVELKEKNKLLERALSEVQAHERRLTQEVERRTAELRKAVAVLEELALRDGLTGLYNHRFFQEALTAELARASRYGRKVALIFLDVDHFKNYNDLLGHPQGDELLKRLARIVANTGDDPEIRIRGRVSDIAARYGGEEFVIILPDSDRAGGAIRAERLRKEIEEFPFAGGEKQPGGRVTVSIGVSGYPEDAINKEELIHAADQALLLAKRAGRNRVCLAAGRS